VLTIGDDVTSQADSIAQISRLVYQAVDALKF
jgi:hypothetical protein